MPTSLASLVFVILVLMLPGCTPGPALQPIDTSPSQSSVDETFRLTELRARGESMVKEKRYNDALALFRSAEKIKPNDPRLLYDIGTTLRYAGSYRESLSYLTRLLELIPHEPQRYRAYGHIGLMHREMGNAAAAVEAFRNVLAIKPDDMEAMAQLASLYCKAQQYGLCKQYIELFIKTVSAHPPALLTDDDRRWIRGTLEQMSIYMRAIQPQSQGVRY